MVDNKSRRISDSIHYDPHRSGVVLSCIKLKSPNKFSLKIKTRLLFVTKKMPSVIQGFNLLCFLDM